MKWNFDEWNRKHGHNSMPSYAFIHCLSELEKRTGKKICEQLVDQAGKENPRGTYEVLFSVNGVELDFTDVFTAYEQQMDRLIAAEAEKLINKKFDTLVDSIESIRTEGLQNVREKLGLSNDV